MSASLIKVHFSISWILSFYLPHPHCHSSVSSLHVHDCRDTVGTTKVAVGGELNLYFDFLFFCVVPSDASVPGLLLPTFSLQVQEHTIESDFFPFDQLTLLKSSVEFFPSSVSLRKRQECSPCEFFGNTHLVGGGAWVDAVDTWKVRCVLVHDLATRGAFT